MTRLFDRIPRRFFGFGHDMVVATAMFPAALILRVGLADALAWPGIARNTAILAAVAACLLPLFALNSGAWRYASLRDAFAILQFSTVIVLVFTLAVFIVDRNASLPRTLPFIMWILMMFGLGAPRFAYRLVKDRLIAPRYGPLRRGRPETPVIVYGFNDAADLFARAVARGQIAGVRIVGIIDDRAKNQGRRLHGARVVGGLDDLADVLRGFHEAAIMPEKLVVADHRLGKPALIRLIDKASEAGLLVERLPAPSAIGASEAPEPRAIELEDLLGRDPANLDLGRIKGLIAGRSILVTGAGGSIGSELCRQIAAFGPARLALVDSSEFALYNIETALGGFAAAGGVLRAELADVRDRRRMFALIGSFRPDVVFHAAALKHVPIVEAQVAEGVKTNVLGTVNVADATLAAGARAFVMVSTDKAVNPTNVMGLTKRVAEAYCQLLDITSERTRFATVRFGNVLGSSGSVVPRFRAQIEAGGPVTVTHPAIERYFMTIPEAAQLVLQASAFSLASDGARGRILVLDMGAPVKIVDLARRMIQLSGRRPDDVAIRFTGLRPGEKMYEELFEGSEQLHSSGVDGVMIATPRPGDRAAMEAAIEEVRGLVEGEDPEAIIAALRRLVPQYAGLRGALPGEPDAVSGTVTRFSPRRGQGPAAPR